MELVWHEKDGEQIEKQPSLTINEVLLHKNPCRYIPDCFVHVLSCIQAYEEDWDIQGFGYLAKSVCLSFDQILRTIDYHHCGQRLTNIQIDGFH